MTERLASDRARPAPEAGEVAHGAPQSLRNARRALALLFVVAALGTRFYRLGDRPLHHDDSIHAFQSTP